VEVKLELENIGVFRGRREFRFSRGLNIVYAPNAAGKSSLVAGLKVATISDLTSDELKRVLNDYEDRGRVRLMINGNEYIVELIRKPDNTVEAWGKRLVSNGIIRRVAFIDLENDLVRAIYAGREDLVEKILRETSGINYIETILTAIEGLKSEYEHIYEIKRQDYESRKEEIENQLRDIEKRISEVRKRINEILRDPRIESVRKEMEEIQRLRKEQEEKLSKLRIEEIRTNNEINEYKSKERELKAELEVYKSKHKRLVKELKEIEKKIIEYRRRIEALQKEIRKLELDKEQLVTELHDKEGVLKRRKEVLEYAQCPYCGTPIDKNKLEKEIFDLENEIDELRNSIEEVSKKIERKRIEIEELKHSGEKRLEKIKKEIEETVEKITEREREIRDVMRKCSNAKRRLKEIRERIKKLEEEISILDKRLELIRKENPQIDTLIEELKQLQSEEHDLLERRDYLYGRLEQLKQLYSDVIALRNKIEILKLFLEYFKIRLNELKRIVVDNINEVILKHFKLLRLADLEYPILTEDFTLKLTRAKGVNTSLAELSDAEKAILTILITIALKDFIASDFPFYVVDTLIEFIDDTRAKAILEYLMEVAGKNKVLIVTKVKPYTGEVRLLTQEDILVNKLVV